MKQRLASDWMHNSTWLADISLLFVAWSKNYVLVADDEDTEWLDAGVVLTPDSEQQSVDLEASNLRDFVTGILYTLEVTWDAQQPPGPELLRQMLRCLTSYCVWHGT